MSIIYYLFVTKVGYFSIGRFIDLFQIDLVIVLLTGILTLEIKRWNRIKDK